MVKPPAKRPKNHTFSLAEKLCYLRNILELSWSLKRLLVVSIDDPVAKDNDEEDELNDQLSTVSIQQVIQNLKE